MTKVCSKCKCEKPIEDFHRNKRAKDGRHGYCKPCFAVAWKASKVKCEAERKARQELGGDVA